jgi:hypothetical protein
VTNAVTAISSSSQRGRAPPCVGCGLWISGASKGHPYDLLPFVAEGAEYKRWRVRRHTLPCRSGGDAEWPVLAAHRPLSSPEAVRSSVRRHTVTEPLHTAAGWSTAEPPRSLAAWVWRRGACSDSNIDTGAPNLRWQQPCLGTVLCARPQARRRPSCSTHSGAWKRRISISSTCKQHRIHRRADCSDPKLDGGTCGGRRLL